MSSNINKMRFIIFSIYLISTVTYSQVELSEFTQKKVVNTVNQYLDLSSFNYKAINSIPELGLKEDHVFKIYIDGEVLGYFALDQSMGQYDYFDYLVLFDQDLTILTVKLLTYREDYGYEISSRWWLSQFIGKKYGKQMLYKQDIDALSGATISAESITNSLKILSANMYYWKGLDMI